MSITATRFATQIRTWLLIAGLTALLIAIGAAIGGGALYISAALAVLMNVAGYWFSDRLAFGRQPRAPAGGRRLRSSTPSRATWHDVLMCRCRGCI